MRLKPPLLSTHNIATSSVYGFLLLLALFTGNSHSIAISELSRHSFTVQGDKTAFVSNRCTHGRAGEVCATKYSRSSPEMELIKSSINNPSIRLGRLARLIGIPKSYLYREMEDLLRRGITVNKIKKLYYEKLPMEWDFWHTEEVYVPPFRPRYNSKGNPEVDYINLIGRDIDLYKDGEFNLQRNKYKVEDILCQTLISAILEYDKISLFQSDLVKVPSEDLFEYMEKFRDKGDGKHTERDAQTLADLQDLVYDSFVANEHNAPTFLPGWNREYLRGRSELIQRGASQDAIDKYDLEHYNKVKDFNSKIIRNLRIFNQINSDFKLTTLYTDLINLYDDKVMTDRWTEYLSNNLLLFLHKYSKFEPSGPGDSISDDEFDFDQTNMYINLVNNKFIKRRKLYELERMRKQYIDFNLNLRKMFKNWAAKPVPFWVWDECFRDRDNKDYENLYKLLKEIVVSDPFVDLGELTRGTVRNLYSAFVPEEITKGSISRMMDGIFRTINRADNAKIAEVVRLINLYTKDDTHEIAVDPGYRSQKEGHRTTEPLSPSFEGPENEIDLLDIVDRIVERQNRNREEGYSRQSIEVVKVHEHGAPREDLTPSEAQEKRTAERKRIRDLIEKEGSELEVKSTGHDLKEVLSFDKFEEAYRRFNRKHFGTDDYELYKGQLVRGKVYRVTRNAVYVDIHAFCLGTMTLNRFYKTPSEVPLNGFLSIFRPGDELMFEVDEIWDDAIMLSMCKIRNFHRFKGILEEKKKGNIFFAKVIQRYSKGVLVEYPVAETAGDESPGYSPEQSSSPTGSDAQASGHSPQPEAESSGESTPSDTAEKSKEQLDFDEYIRRVKHEQLMNNIGWVPLRNLSRDFKDPRHIVDINLVGKTIPVMFEFYDTANNIPVLSNKQALRRMKIMHMRVGDIVKGRVTKYRPYYIAVKFGGIDGALSVEDMSEENYRQHLVAHPKSVMCRVKYVDPVNDTVVLSTKNMFEAKDSSLLGANGFLRKFRKEPHSVQAASHNEALAAIRRGEARLNPGTGEIVPVEDLAPRDPAQGPGRGAPSGAPAAPGDPSACEVPASGSYVKDVPELNPLAVEWRLVGDKLLDDPTLMHGYRLHRWLIYLGQWMPFPDDIQRALNYQFNNFNDVGYFDYLGERYKIDFDKSVAYTLKGGTEYVFEVKRVPLFR